MKQQPKKKKNLITLIVDLFRDIFFGGSEYETVKVASSPFPIAAIVGVITTTMLFLALIFSLIKASELSTEIATIKKELVSVSAKADTLEGEFSRRYPFSDIQQYADEHGLSADGGRVIILPDETEETSHENAIRENASSMNIFASICKKIRELFK